MTYEEDLNRVIACVHPMFTVNLCGGKTTTTTTTKAAPFTVDSSFVEHLLLFTDERISDTPMLLRVGKWCRLKFLPEGAADFLSKRKMQTLLWAMMLPLSWLQDQRTILESSLAMWHPFPVASREANEIRRLISQMVVEMPNYASECAAALSASVRAARVAKVAKEDSELLSRACFPATVPRETRTVVCLLVRLGVTSVRIPHYVLPRRGKIYAERMNVLRLIAKMPKHIDGLQFERRFASTVYGDPGVHCLHAALIFCTTEWVEEFKLRGLTRSLAQKKALAALHASSFAITYDDALELLELCV